MLGLLAIRRPRPLAFPDRPVRIIVPYAPGGGNDALARVLGQKLEEQWGKPVIVENKSGGNTIIATDYVAKQPADGYTILMVSTVFSVNPSLVAKLPYDTLANLHAGGARRHGAERAGHQARAAGQLGQGIDRLRACQSRQADLRLPRRRHDAASRGRALQQRCQHQGGRRGLPRHAAAAHGAPVGRPRLHVRCHQLARARRDRQAQGPRGHGLKRLEEFPEIPTMQEVRPAGLRGLYLVRLRGAGRHAARDRRPRSTRASTRASTTRRCGHGMDGLGIQLARRLAAGLRPHIRAEMDKWGAVIRKAGIKPEAQ